MNDFFYNGLQTRMKPQVLKRVAQQVLLALRHIHQQGFVHCDLKPENIALRHRNKTGIKLLDFGSVVREG